MQRISRKISKDPVLLFDWIMCILFGLLALGGMVLLFLVSQKQVVMGWVRSKIVGNAKQAIAD